MLTGDGGEDPLVDATWLRDEDPLDTEVSSVADETPLPDALRLEPVQANKVVAWYPSPLDVRPTVPLATVIACDRVLVG